MGNQARVYLETAYPDRVWTPDNFRKLEQAGQLEWTKALLRTLVACGENVAPAGSSPLDEAMASERRHLETLRVWRDRLAAKVANPRLGEVELLFVGLSSPQAVAIHEQDGSYAIGLDRRLHGFMASITAWAYVAATLELHGAPPEEGRRLLLQSLADHVQLAYLGRPLPDEFHLRELELQRQLSPLDRSFINQASLFAQKFVLLHELGHVQLGHFTSGTVDATSRDATAEVSAFREHELEYAADAFAQEHLMDGENTLTAALVARVAGPVYFNVVALKEAMMPARTGAARAMIGAHPPGAARASRLGNKPLPLPAPASFEACFAVPKLLESVRDSALLQEAARCFADRVGSADAAFE